MNMFTFPFPLFCCTMISPTICVGGRVVKRILPNNVGVNNANKQYKCALKCLLVIYLNRVWSLGHRPVIVK